MAPTAAMTLLAKGGETRYVPSGPLPPRLLGVPIRLQEIRPLRMGAFASRVRAIPVR